MCCGSLCMKALHLKHEHKATCNYFGKYVDIFLNWHMTADLGLFLGLYIHRDRLMRPVNRFI